MSPRSDRFPDSAARGVARDLKRAIAGEVRFDDGSRALYSTDGSNYRQVPIGVVIPRSIEDGTRGARPLPRLQRVQARLPGQRRHGDL